MFGLNFFSGDLPEGNKNSKQLREKKVVEHYNDGSVFVEISSKNADAKRYVHLKNLRPNYSLIAAPNNKNFA